MAQRYAQPPAESTPGKVLRWAQKAQQVAGVAHSIYQVGRVAAPYVAAGIAVLQSGNPPFSKTRCAI